MDSELLIEGPEDGVVVLRLNRPDKMNALATPLLSAVAQSIDALDDDDNVRAIVLTGGDENFAAGADVTEIVPKQATDGLADPRPAIWATIRQARKPLVAAVEGYCLGAGNELLMCADIAIAGEGARFGQPETNLGIIPGAGGAALLPRIVGQQRAMRMVLLGELMSATEALDHGLVSEVVPDGTATQKAQSLAVRIAKRAPLAVMQGKAVVKAAFDQPLQAHLKFERLAFSMVLGTQDKEEGVSAFLERRDPSWRGK